MKVLTVVRTTGGLARTMHLSSVIVLVLVTVVTIVIVESAVIRDDGCTLSINYKNGDLKEPQPLILNNGKNASFLDPIDERGTLKLETGQAILVACPGPGNFLQGISGLTNVTEIAVNCLRGKTFTLSSIRFNFTSLSCKFLPKHMARRTTNRCYGDAAHVEIGFLLKSTFVRTIEICRDDTTMMTYWTKFRLTKSIAGFQSGFPRPFKWEIGNFYGKYNIDYQFKTNTQINTIEEQVGSRQLALKYINPATDRFMARGHMTAKADFVYGSAQTSTFWLINAAPQWQTFNAGNWNTLESNVRQYAAKRTADLDVYTGTYGQMSLDDVNDNKVPIYLYVNGTKRAFPVPKFYWKIIHDRASKKATAFIGTNDPWAKSITDDMLICDNIANKIKWLSWKPTNIVKGISYVCSVDDLRESIPYVPSLNVNGILV